MSFQVGSTCYGSAQAALSAIASGQVGSVVSHGGSAYVVDAPAVSSTSIQFRLTPVGGGTPLTITQIMAPEPCQLLDAADGALLGWSIAAAWICTAVVVSLRKAADQ